MKHRSDILHFDDINESHESMGFVGRTNLPDFHVFTLAETYPSTRKVMPPYTLSFYCIMLLERNSHDAVVELDTQRMNSLSHSISFQAPGHVSSWIRGEAQQGFIIYFKPEFLSHYVPSLLTEFPFFGVNEIHLLNLSNEQEDALRDHCVQMVRTFKNDHVYRTAMLQALLLAFLFDCKGLYENQLSHKEQRSPETTLAFRFQQLLEQHYLTQQSVQAYAKMLQVTPNHLSQAVSHTFGQGAYTLITDRLILEAKKLLRYTDLNITEIADYLGFKEPTHFGRFFKHKTLLTPLEYRRCANNREHDG